MSGTINVYAIFWEPTNSKVDPNYNKLLERYYQDVGGTPLYNIMHQYTQKSGGSPTKSVLAGSWIDTKNAYPGDKLSEGEILAEVERAMQMNTGGWPQITTSRSIPRRALDQLMMCVPITLTIRHIRSSMPICSILTQSVFRPKVRTDAWYAIARLTPLPTSSLRRATDQTGPPKNLEAWQAKKD